MTLYLKTASRMTLKMTPTVTFKVTLNQALKQATT